MIPEDLLQIRRNPGDWFRGFGRVADLVTRAPLCTRTADILKGQEPVGTAKTSRCYQHPNGVRELTTGSPQGASGGEH